ncbi:metal ABC transporter ATP-binding protein [soil metagenome]
MHRPATQEGERDQEAAKAGVWVSDVGAGDLRVRGLAVSYRRTTVLRDVDLDAPAGAVTGIVGPNGAGKSTLLKAVLGLIRPDSGRVEVAGGSVDAARRRITYVPQRSAIDWDYPAQVGEVVTMGRYPHLGMLRRMRDGDRALVDAALDRVGLSDYRSRQIGELSGGQQQRVFLARALAQQASLLVLDEPFAGVDAPTVTLLGGLLRELAAGGVAVVMVNHDLSMLRELTDRLVLLNGTVVAAGTTDDVLTSDKLAATYGGLSAQFASLGRT